MTEQFKNLSKKTQNNGCKTNSLTQRSTKHTKHKAKDQATQTPLKNNKSNRNTTNFIDV
jgi:hypothetical protein